MAGASGRSYNTKDSPFLELRCPFTALEGLQMAIMLPLLPFRLAIGGGALVLIALVNSFAAYNWPVDKPLTPWRRRLVLASKELVWVVFTMLGFRVSVSGREHIRPAEEVGAVALFNHVSWLDAFILVWLIAPSGVAKSSNAHLPVIKHAVRALQTVYIPESRLRKSTRPEGAPAVEAPATNSDPPNSFVVHSKVTEVLRKRVGDPMYCKLGGYPMVVMAPEGTCGNGACLLEFRTGAFVLGRPVLPICLHYKWKTVNPAWTIIPEAFHFLRLTSQFANVLDVTILPPYVPDAAELEDPKLYASNVRALMGRTMGLPLVSANHDDFVMLSKLKVKVSLDGRRVMAPPGVVNSDGFIDVEKHWQKKAD